MHKETLDPPTPSRKARFRAALALAHKTARDWAQEREITTGHLYAVLSGDRDSAVLNTEIDAFIATHLPPAA